MTGTSTLFDRPGEAVQLVADAMRAARQVVRDRHYTRCTPSGKSRYFVFENVIVIYSIPANRFAARAVLGRDAKVWELTRLWAPHGHAPNPLTRAISATVRAFARVERDVEAVVSYADPNAGHHGGAYQAASWTYQGQSTESRIYRDASGQCHARRKFHSGGRHLLKTEIEALGYKQENAPGKLRYAKGLSRRACREIAASAKPYPNRRTEAA